MPLHAHASMLLPPCTTSPFFQFTAFVLRSQTALNTREIIVMQRTFWSTDLNEIFFPKGNCEKYRYVMFSQRYTELKQTGLSSSQRDMGGCVIVKHNVALVRTKQKETRRLRDFNSCDVALSGR